jgi:hypothetical protein
LLHALEDDEKREKASLFFNKLSAQLKDDSYRIKINAAVLESKIAFLFDSAIKSSSLDGIEELSWITDLKISFSNLATLPKAIEGMVGLEVLEISNNDTLNLDDFDFSKLPHLKRLFLVENHLTTIPKSIENCHLLEKLDLSRNKIAASNLNLLALTHLSEINLSGNEFEVFPDFLQSTSNLEKLWLSSEKLQSCFFDFSFLPHLRFLDMSCCRLTEIPPFLGNAKNLKVVRFYQNAISSIDYPFDQLSQIEQIDLSNNKLNRLSKKLRELPESTNIIVSGNPLNLNSSGYDYSPFLDPKIKCKISNLCFDKVICKVNEPKQVYREIFKDSEYAIVPQGLHGLQPSEIENIKHLSLQDWMQFFADYDPHILYFFDKLYKYLFKGEHYRGDSEDKNEKMVFFIKDKNIFLNRLSFIMEKMKELSTEKKDKYIKRWIESYDRGPFYFKEFLEYVYLKFKRQSFDKGSGCIVDHFKTHLAYIKNELFIKSVMPFFDINRLDTLFQLRYTLRPFIHFTEFFEYKDFFTIPLYEDAKLKSYQVNILKIYYQKFSVQFLKKYTESLFRGELGVFSVDELSSYFRSENLSSMELSSFFEALVEDKGLRLTELGAYYLLSHIHLLRHRNDKSIILELVDPYIIVKADDVDESAGSANAASSANASSGGKALIIRGAASQLQPHSVILNLEKLIQSEDYQVSSIATSEALNDEDLLDGFTLID